MQNVYGAALECVGPSAEASQKAEASLDLKAMLSATWPNPQCVQTESGFGLLGDFRDVARSVDYLVIDLWEGWKARMQEVLACVQGL